MKDELDERGSCGKGKEELLITRDTLFG